MITIKLFGLLKALAGDQSEVKVLLNEGNTIRGLVGALEAQYPQIGELIHNKRVLVSVNQEIIHGDAEVKEGDEVALLPPFAGGTSGNIPYRSANMPESVPDALLARMQRENFSIDAEIDRVRSRSRRIGGIAVFLGIARDRSRGHDVSAITFEHYEGMAQKRLREIRERALKDFDVFEVLILHRYGEIAIGENIVLVVVGAEHRADAFKACKWCIDELKQITPIWKLERTPEGAIWVEEHP